MSQTDASSKSFMEVEEVDIATQIASIPVGQPVAGLQVGLAEVQPSANAVNDTGDSEEPQMAPLKPTVVSSTSPMVSVPVGRDKEHSRRDEPSIQPSSHNAYSSTLGPYGARASSRMQPLIPQSSAALGGDDDRGVEPQPNNNVRRYATAKGVKPRPVLRHPDAARLWPNRPLPDEDHGYYPLTLAIEGILKVHVFHSLSEVSTIITHV